MTQRTRSGAQGVDRDRRRERRIDAAREAEHHARKAVLVRRSRASRASGPGRPPPCPSSGADHLAIARSSRRRRPARHSVSRPAPPRTAAAGRAERQFGIEHEGGAVEHQFVLAADLVDVDHAAGRSRSPWRRRAGGARRSCPSRKGEPFGITIRISAPDSSRHSGHIRDPTCPRRPCTPRRRLRGSSPGPAGVPP